MAKKSNKSMDVYPPLALLKRESAKYPKAWEQMGRFHEQKGQAGLPMWPDWCYAPIGAALSVTMGNRPDTIDNRLDSIQDAQIVAALAPWRHSKEAFVIDEGMQELLFEQADDLKLEPETLLNLPYPCFYIQFAPDTALRGTVYHGLFVHLEYDTNTGGRELRLLYLSEKGQTMGVPVYIDAGTLEESIEETCARAHDNLPEGYRELRRVLDKESERRSDSARFYKQTLQIVLYLCAQNAEITPNPEQVTHTRRSVSVKDRYAEIRKWDVGVRIGNAVRAYRSSTDRWAKANESDASAGHASPRPHMRRGHWHNFWTGKKDGSEERKLVLKWVAPTFVNAAQEDEIPVTLHRVPAPNNEDKQMFDNTKKR